MTGLEPATAAVRSLSVAGRTVAAAESLTGGLVCAALTSVPGASAVVRGGVVVYATDLKTALAGVEPAVLDREGPVSAEVARAMADGVRHRLGADVGVATTGVAGPEPQDGHRPGTVHVALASPEGVVLRSCADADRLTGDRDAVRRRTVEIAIGLLATAAAGNSG
ncbi:nicotinamide-nucleotide amidase [Haloactinopolyspora alba]|uniref:Nicotinamide-nucleotide amidase n=1 Tax=Haloactinopolyspora alba TaxID=648780 RepID=A0A2P8DV36_9ACTN|nr:nicotinamide-nucleotide amidohydrolase family protein [Haloactinopolyspora alba]PSL01093.1 nicotinamide-nucleotide amidase [Haloactinopolyspora alba]